MGFISLVRSVKENRALLKKRKKRTKDDVYGIPKETKLEFKPATPHAMKSVREKIAANKRKNTKATVIAMTLAIIITLSLSLWGLVKLKLLGFDL